MKDRRGFTLLEIMIVIAIVGIMAVVATTNFFSWQSHYSGVGFQREFLSRVSEARTRSIGTSLQHRLRIDLGTETVVLEQGNAGTASGTWVSVAPQVVGTRGAGIHEIAMQSGSRVGHVRDIGIHLQSGWPGTDPGQRGDDPRAYGR